MKLLSIKIAGESGMGINSTGEMISKIIKNFGLYNFGYREYPSLIEGGVASYQIDISDKSINSSSKNCDILICISRESIYEYLHDINEGGLLVHSLPRLILNQEQKDYITQKNIELVYIDTEEIIKRNYGSAVMTNIIMLGYLMAVLGVDIELVNKQIEHEFENKPNYIGINQKLLKEGYALIGQRSEQVSGGIDSAKIITKDFSIKSWDKTVDLKEAYIMSGNHSLSLGSISAGVRAYYAYPMTPASSILTYLASVSGQTGMLIKQAEDEITAAQMVIGSMAVGTRAFTATSGGGFDLMTESVSLAGISETPMVVVLAQRPGPATGLPTWTAAGDLDVAIYAGHGEYPKCVISVSDAEDAYELIQQSFNIAEKYQIPVILLTEKQIAESNFLVNDLRNIRIERNLFDAVRDAVKVDGEIVNNENVKKSVEQIKTDRSETIRLGRFCIKEPISKRWLPGTSDNYYLSNSDEHDEFGDSVEDADTSERMMQKRMAKLDLLKNALPEPVIYGDINAEFVLVGWGSVKNTVLDTLPEKGFMYIHYTYLFPLKIEKLESLFKEGKKIVLIENNYTGQLGKLIKQNSRVEFFNELLKYDGRPFFHEDLMNLYEDLMK